MNCEHQPIIEGGANPCPHCPPIPTQASMDKLICVGFGEAFLSRDGDIVADGEHWQEGDGFLRFSDAEALASADPEHDWRVVLHGPLHGETYQRQGNECWVLIDRNEGFA